ncbi:MAG: M48 family metallopeptidase [Verrucomicrobiota bacterium JB022]|nr:M48 family metallopeptidase [Verrucomicrobiota bacterium JB022]
MAQPSTDGTLDFFGAQEQAHRKSGWLLLYFALAVALIVLGVNLLVTGGWVFLLTLNEERSSLPAGAWWSWPRFGVVSGITVLIIVIAAWSKLEEYNQGGGAVARSLGGRKVDETTRQPAERRLLNVVEEMALAAGVPVPEVYVLENEAAINAFAAGTTIENAAVAVTQGTLDSLTRDELQGVIGHEFSHILNGDMRLNIRIGGMLFGIMALAILAGGLLRGMFGGPRAAYPATYSTRRKGEGNGNAGAFILVLVVVAVGVYVLGQIGTFFGHLIQAAISRQREFLADASAVQFTRNPEGLAGALKKIGGWSQRGKLTEPKASAMAHLFFANALNTQWLGLMATHPPLKERILRVDPGWDGKFSRPEETRREATKPPPIPPQGEPLNPAQMVMMAGAIQSTSLEYARRLRQTLPRGLRSVGEDPQLSRFALLGLMVDREFGGQRERQLNWLLQRYPDHKFQLNEVVQLVDELPRSAHLPLLELASNALRQASMADAESLREELQHLAQVDRRVDLREWCILTIALRRLERNTATPPIQTEVPPVAGAMSRVLSRIVELDQSGDRSAAFRQALQGLYLAKYLQYVPAGEAKTDELTSDLESLRPCSPPMKSAFLQACGRAIQQDAQITAEEAELFRALAIGLGVPMPPVIVQ